MFRLCFLVVFVGFVLTGNAQVVDKIVAKVDDYIVLKSDIEGTYQSYVAQDQRMPPDARCGIMQQLLIEKVMLAQAEIDSVIVDPIRVEGELERRMGYFISQYGSQEEMERVLKKSVEELKDELRDQVREQLTVQRMREEITMAAEVTPAQVKRFYENIPQDSLPLFPATYEVAQLVKYPEVNAKEKDKIRLKLIEIRQEIVDSKSDFAIMAKKYSEDVGSAANGGCYDFVERGQFVPEYEATAFKLEPGEISMPVESEFGFHIIKLIERRGNRFKSCHILMKPKPTESDFEKTEHLLDSLRLLVVEEKVDFARLAQKLSDDRNTRSSGGSITNPQTGSSKVAIDDLDYATFETIDELEVGQVSKPIRYRTADERDAVRIVYYKQKTPPHLADFEQDYERLYNIALQNEKNRRLAEWFDRTITDIYFYLDDEYNECGLLDGL